ncbi:MAG: glycoside hydrolase family 127 protein [Verrucomicrobia bacterium]|nr:glycoside hydrolase family 127 protein [Verrucomicrobiota bacterium]
MKTTPALPAVLLAGALCCPFAAPATAPLDRVQPVIVLKAVPFSLTEVRLLEGPFRDAMQRDRDYLLSVDPDRLLHTFRVNAGLPSTAEPLGGWEAPKVELRGHSLGHYLSACALMYASTGEPKLKARTDSLVAELAKCQAALAAGGSHAGYLSAFPETFLDRVDARQPVWAPWYTLHKILAGLLDVHRHGANPQALDVLVKMTDWVKTRVDRLTPEQMQRSLETEFGGMNEVLANIYAVTGNPEHLRIARAFDHKAVFDPLARHEDRLNGLHANTQIPKFIGAAREYELTGEPAYREIARFAWERVALARSYVIGGHSDHEHFFPVERFSKQLSPATCETCNTYNMLKLTRHLFAWEPSATLMDFYERALYNHILASQDPRTGMFMYFASLKPGHFKTYSKPFDSFWCCVGTGMENHAKYADSIYHHDADSLYVNLFIPSELTWKDKGLALRLETRFPEEDIVRLRVLTPPASRLGAIRVRCPAWAGDGVRFRVNGASLPLATTAGQYAALDRAWKRGDTVEIRLPMRLRVVSMPDDPDVVALAYGPIVLAGELGREGLDRIEPYARSQLDLAHVPAVTVPAFVGDRATLLDRVHPVPGQPLTFQTRGLGRPGDVTLIPYYRLHHQRFSVYWNVMSEDAWRKRQAGLAVQEAERRALDRRTVDAVSPGEPQPETDHQFQGENTQAGTHMNRRWRHAADGGWFSYEIKVAPDQAMTLRCTYWGEDAGARTFEVLVDGRRIATQTLDRNRPGEFYDEEYPVPTALTRGKSRVSVRFQAHPGNIAGGLFGLRMLRPATP